MRFFGMSGVFVALAADTAVLTCGVEEISAPELVANARGLRWATAPGASPEVGSVTTAAPALPPPAGDRTSAIPTAATPRPWAVHG
jgi:hypothetical protein